MSRPRKKPFQVLLELSYRFAGELVDVEQVLERGRMQAGEEWFSSGIRATMQVIGVI